MRETDESARQYLLFVLGKNIYAVDSMMVKSMERLGTITEMTGADKNVLGSSLYKGHPIYLVDTRRIFGLKNQIDEFEEAVNIKQRIKDHENWVKTLEKSVRERKPFTMAEDPHLCAFGKWYYNFHTENNTLRHELKKIERPHAEVHHTAVAVKELMQKDKQEEALAAIAKMEKTNYKKTLEILSELRETVQNSLREVCIVLDSPTEEKGLVVDSIVGLEYLEKIKGSDDVTNKEPCLDFLAQRGETEDIIMVLNDLILGTDY